MLPDLQSPHLGRVVSATEDPLQGDLRRGKFRSHRGCRLGGASGETPVGIRSRAEAIEGPDAEGVPRVGTETPHPDLRVRKSVVVKIGAQLLANGKVERARLEWDARMLLVRVRKMVVGTKTTSIWNMGATSL